MRWEAFHYFVQRVTWSDLIFNRITLAVLSKVVYRVSEGSRDSNKETLAIIQVRYGGGLNQGVTMYINIIVGFLMHWEDRSTHFAIE